MFSQNLAKLSKKRHVIILLDVLQMGGGCAPPNPPRFFLGQLLSKQIFARLGKKWRFAILFDVLQMGGAAAPPTPPLIFIAPHSQARHLAALSRKRHRDTFSTSKLIREFKSVDSYEDGDPDTRDPCDGRHF